MNELQSDQSYGLLYYETVLLSYEKISKDLNAYTKRRCTKYKLLLISSDISLERGESRV